MKDVEPKRAREHGQGELLRHETRRARPEAHRDDAQILPETALEERTVLAVHEEDVAALVVDPSEMPHEAEQ
ncbi:MAG: hypothetical protein FJ144_19120 [Deltaproteobacteria bacterium]|nr:hypothetical protein [Deltaproteobacteria bacterium]